MTNVLPVAFVSSHGQLGGSEKVLEDLIKGLDPRDVSGVIVLQEGPLVEKLRDNGVPTQVIPTSGSRVAVLGTARELRRRLKPLAPHVIHANGVKAAIVCVLATRKVPVVWMKHDVSFDGKIGRSIAARCAAIAGVSEEVLRSLSDRTKTTVVHPGVSVDQRAAEHDGAELKRSLRLSRHVVSVIGRLEPSKGHGEALETLPAISAEVGEVNLLLVGGDDENHPGIRSALRQRAEELGCSDQVYLLSHTPAPAVIAASDVVVVPTVPSASGQGREGFGLVAAEALSLGTPVVAYRVGATEEVLGECGVLVAPADRAALAAGITKLLVEEALRLRLADCGRTRARAFSVEKMVGQMTEIYRRVAS